MKEYWICKDNILDECDDAHVYHNKPLWAKDLIHVVEFSAVESLRLEVAELELKVINLILEKANRQTDQSLQTQVALLEEELKITAKELEWVNTEAGNHEVFDKEKEIYKRLNGTLEKLAEMRKQK